MQKIQHLRQQNEIRERDAAQKQKHGRNDEPGRRPPLVLVKPRRDKQPHLIKHPRHRQHNAQVDAQIDDQADVAGGAGVIELVVQMIGAQRRLASAPTMKPMKRLETSRPTMIPAPTPISAATIRLRSSTRWSKNDIAAGVFFGCLSARALRLGGFRHRSVSRGGAPNRSAERLAGSAVAGAADLPERAFCGDVRRRQIHSARACRCSRCGGRVSVRFRQRRRAGGNFGVGCRRRCCIAGTWRWSAGDAIALAAERSCPALIGFALKIPQMPLEGRAQIARGSLEFAHQSCRGCAPVPAASRARTPPGRRQTR